MIEPIMYLAIGFLVSMLFGLMIVPLVHNRAVRLTTRRMEAATPLSMAEIQADKDQLRAEFAMSARRLEMSVDQLKNKTTSQLAELGKKSDAINRMKIELGEKTATIFSLEAREKSIKDQLRRDLAISYLSHSSRSVMDIALELGFSERSAFHRAFRKWTGASPGDELTTKAVNLEVQYDKSLSGKPGEQTIVRDPFGRAISIEHTTPARPGKAVFLTLDHTIQANAEQVLRQTVSKWGAKSATKSGA